MPGRARTTGTDLSAQSLDRGLRPYVGCPLLYRIAMVDEQLQSQASLVLCALRCEMYWRLIGHLGEFRR